MMQTIKNMVKSKKTPVDSSTWKKLFPPSLASKLLPKKIKKSRKESIKQNFTFENPYQDWNKSTKISESSVKNLKSKVRRKSRNKTPKPYKPGSLSSKSNTSKGSVRSVKKYNTSSSKSPVPKSIKLKLQNSGILSIIAPNRRKKKIKRTSSGKQNETYNDQSQISSPYTSSKLTPMNSSITNMTLSAKK